MGIDFIEAGIPVPIEGPEFFERLDITEDAKIVAFGSTRRKEIEAKDDPNLRSLIGAGTKIVSIFGKKLDFHVTDILRTTPEENLAMIEDSVPLLP